MAFEADIERTPEVERHLPEILTEIALLASEALLSSTLQVSYMKLIQKVYRYGLKNSWRIFLKKYSWIIFSSKTFSNGYKHFLLRVKFVQSFDLQKLNLVILWRSRTLLIILNLYAFSIKKA